MKKKLIIIIPVFNEEKLIKEAIYDWIDLNKKIELDIIIINDGSTDKSINIIMDLADKYSFIKFIDKKNEGHGKSIIKGYKYAIDNNYEYIFQTDSDLQFKSKDFHKLWDKKILSNELILGYRKKRHDSFLRVFLSKVWLKLFIFIISQKLLKDPNVPYRLIKYDFLKSFLNKIENKNFIAPNILMTIFAKNTYFVEVEHFKRKEGELEWKISKLINFGTKLIKEIIIFRFSK